MTSTDELEVSGSLEGRNYLAKWTLARAIGGDDGEGIEIYLWENGEDFNVYGGDDEAGGWQDCIGAIQTELIPKYQASGWELIEVEGVPPEKLPPIPVGRLIRQAVDDASDYDDGIDGYTGHRFDQETGVLEIYYERREGEIENGPDFLHGPAEYRFRLLEADLENVQGPSVDRLCEVLHLAYEKAAVGAGWETQQSSRKPWADVPDANKQTMRAAVQALLDELHR